LQPTTCEICGYKLANMKSVLKHMETHESGPKKARRLIAKSKKKDDTFKRTLKCPHPGCGKAYRNPTTLDAHVRTHEVNGDGDEVAEVNVRSRDNGNIDKSNLSSDFLYSPPFVTYARSPSPVFGTCSATGKPIDRSRRGPSSARCATK
jgi:Zinc finger, C2H2 type